MVVVVVFYLMLVLSHACMDLVLHDSCYVVSHFHFVRSLGSVISLVCGLVCYVDYIVSSQRLSLGL